MSNEELSILYVMRELTHLDDLHNKPYSYYLVMLQRV